MRNIKSKILRHLCVPKTPTDSNGKPSSHSPMEFLTSHPSWPQWLLCSWRPASAMARRSPCPATAHLVPCAAALDSDMGFESSPRLSAVKAIIWQWRFIPSIAPSPESDSSSIGKRHRSNSTSSESRIKIGEQTCSFQDAQLPQGVLLSPNHSTDGCLLQRQTLKGVCLSSASLSSGFYQGKYPAPKKTPPETPKLLLGRNVTTENVTEPQQHWWGTGRELRAAQGRRVFLRAFPSLTIPLLPEDVEPNLTFALGSLSSVPKVQSRHVWKPQQTIPTCPSLLIFPSSQDFPHLLFSLLLLPKAGLRNTSLCCPQSWGGWATPAVP